MGMSYTRALAALAPLLVALVAAAVAGGGAEASTAVASCARGTDGVYTCNKSIVAGNHIFVNVNPGTCHADVTSIGSAPGGLKTAKIRIAHTVAACPWSVGTNVTIAWKVQAGQTVGGTAGLISESVAPGEASAQPSSGYSTYLLAAGALAVAGLAGGAAYTRGRRFGRWGG
jgi:hypothetical protein